MIVCPHCRLPCPYIMTKLIAEVTFQMRLITPREELTPGDMIFTPYRAAFKGNNRIDPRYIDITPDNDLEWGMACPHCQGPLTPSEIRRQGLYLRGTSVGSAGNVPALGRIVIGNTDTHEWEINTGVADHAMSKSQLSPSQFRYR